MVAINNYEKLSEERKYLQSINEIPDWFVTAGFQLFKNKYILPGQTLKERYHQIADSAGVIADELYPINTSWSDKFFDIIWKGWLSPSTPVLANMGTDRGLPVSCSGGVVEDSVYGFYEARLETAILTKYGFGTSAYMGGIRPRGSDISVGGKASGSVPVIKGFVQDMSDISQGFVRRGAWAGYLEIDHGDFHELCDYLYNNPDSLNIGWLISDVFLERLNDGDEEAIGRYKKVMKTRSVTGRGYLLFKDKANRLAPKEFADQGLKIEASNLCVSGDTWVMTKEGPKQIKTLVNFPFIALVNGQEYKASVSWSNGVKPVSELKTKQGHSLILTPDHRVLTTNKGWVEVQSLKDDDKLVINDHSACDTFWGPSSPELFDNGFLLGAFVGDGNFSIKGRGEIKHWGNPGDDSFADAIYRAASNLPHRADWGGWGTLHADGYRSLNIGRLPGEWDIIQGDKHNISHLQDSSSDFIRGFLRGLFDTDGHVECSEENGRPNISVRLGQADYKLLQAVQRMLGNLGIHSKIYNLHEPRKALLPNGHGRQDFYDCKQVWRLVINSRSLQGFIKLIGFSNKVKAEKLSGAISKMRDGFYNIPFVADFESLTPVGEEEVFDVLVEDIHSFDANGLMAHNCSEIFLPSDLEHDFTCVLSSMNASKYEEWKDTDAVFVSTVFLDTVAETLIRKGKKIKGLEKAVRFTEKSRALGLGVLGFHTYVQQQGWAMDDLKTHLFNQLLFKNIREEADRASCYMASFQGSPEWCQGSNRRNLTLLAVAPNMSTAILCGGVSQGIEPVVANVYTQGSQGGEILRINPVLWSIMEERGVYNSDTLWSIVNDNGSVRSVTWLSDDEKKVFKTAFEIDQMVLLRLASVRQRHIDQGQSLNLFFAADEDPKYISQVHRAAAEDPYIKSLYYMRSQAGVQASKGECSACEG